MPLKLSAVIICAVLLIALGTRGLLNNGGQQKDSVKWADKNSLKEIARRAKAEGKSEAAIPGPFVDYPGMDMSLEEALRNYNVAIAEVVTSKSYPFNSDGVRTWYLFRVRDLLSKSNPPYCHSCPTPPDPPTDLNPLNSDEFLLAVGGGTVSVDGVQITVNNRSVPVFETGEKYLLVMSMTASRVAVLGAGPSGIFRVEEDGFLDPVNNQNYPIQSEIKQNYGRALSNLKSHLK